MRTIITVLIAEGFTAKHIKNKLGVRGSATGDLHFENVKVKISPVPLQTLVLFLDLKLKLRFQLLISLEVRVKEPMF